MKLKFSGKKEANKINQHMIFYRVKCSMEKNLKRKQIGSVMELQYHIAQSKMKLRYELRCEGGSKSICKGRAFQAEECLCKSEATIDVSEEYAGGWCGWSRVSPREKSR